ncbi:glutaredoxin family protein [Psychromonas sp. CD1]|uniref:glutaredoxin family protein n=1 Tax=Psychromonas sp. CD1 TaxID=1979839 RepID=UPI000B9AE98B|nr:glutaredoxin family protein [Psychromonas sp. CD1]
MTKRLTLFHTDRCHLCDDAMALLEIANAPYQKVDILAQPDLMRRYATRIPVVKQEGKSSLNWPFTLQQLYNYIQEEKS